MKTENKLNYSRKHSNNSKKFRSFIIGFAAFVVVLGVISLLMFMKSLNFNLKNIVSSSEELSTEENTEETTVNESITGNSNVIIICSNTDGDLSFAFLLKTDYDSMKSEVVYVPLTLTVSYAGTTTSLNAYFKNGGAESYVQAFKEYSKIDVNKYILVNETQFRNFMSKFSDVTVNVPNAITGDNAQGLSLDKGPQNLTADLLLKYIKYCDNAEKTKAACSTLEVIFEEKNNPSIDKLFAYLSNNSQSNISIIDFTNEKDKISAFMQAKGEFVPLNSLSELLEVSK